MLRGREAVGVSLQTQKNKSYDSILHIYCIDYASVSNNNILPYFRRRGLKKLIIVGWWNWQTRLTVYEVEVAEMSLWKFESFPYSKNKKK
jgi:hypothetical protein